MPMASMFLDVTHARSLGPHTARRHFNIADAQADELRPAQSGNGQDL
jgi:hypothetical protein